MVNELLAFLTDNYFMIIYGVALILSVYKYKYYYDSALKTFPIIIGYVLLTEILGFLIAESNEIQLVFEEGYANHNHLIYNILDIILFLYFIRVFRKSISNLRSKQLILYGTIGFLLISICNAFFQDFRLHPQLATMGFGAILLIFCALTYYMEIKEKPKRFSNYNRLLRHIVVGILLFYPFYPVIISVGYFNPGLFLDLDLRTLLFTLILIMYSSFIIGFLSLRKIRL